MPRQRWNLTQAEKATCRKQVERLRAAGADLDDSDFAPIERDWIQITHAQVSCVHALQHGSVFIVPTRIVGLAPAVGIQAFELSSPSFDLAAWFLEDATMSRSGSRRYRLRDGTAFLREEVLNHHVDAAGTLRYGEVIEGMLLAESFDAIPTRFADKTLIPICLSITNQFGHVQSSTTEALIERAADRIQLPPVRPSTLFEREDGYSGNPEWVMEAPYGHSLHNRQLEALDQGTGPAHRAAAEPKK